MSEDEMAKVIGFSGSPVKSGNVEQAMAQILESTGHDWELVRLSTKNIRPCVACLACAKNNRCVLKDDMNELLDKILEADAIVLGGFNTYGGLNGLTKVFIERLFPLFHRKMLTQGKVAASVCAGFFEQKGVQEDFSAVFQAYRMQEAGSLAVEGNAACYKCGYGETCEYSALLAKYGAGAKVTEDVIYRFSSDSEAMARAESLGREIAGLMAQSSHG
jgi:multimeric flavodoxin WrbA